MVVSKIICTAGRSKEQQLSKLQEKYKRDYSLKLYKRKYPERHQRKLQIIKELRNLKQPSFQWDF